MKFYLYAAFLAVTSLAQAAKQPNVLLIITDDQGWADIGYNNPDHVYTPNLDRLADAGAKLESHYVMPQCTPSRVALFTGRYPGRFGRAPLMATSKKCFPVGTPTLATMMKSVGYETYLVGKWHMGEDPGDGPNIHGFDYSYGSLSGAVGMYDHHYRKGEHYETWQRNMKLIPGSDNGKHVTDLEAEDAIRIIHEKHDKPFFMYLAFHAVHDPLDERGQFTNEPTRLDPANPNRWHHEDQIKWFNDPAGKIQKEPEPAKRLLLAAAYHLDYAVGEVIDALDKSGQRDNTLILFTSDNGPVVSWGGHAYPDDLKLSNLNQPLPMRGHKTDVWEGGIHVAGFANWPGHIAPKAVTEPEHIIDWFPTLAHVVGAATPANLDGRDISPLLFDHDTMAQRDFYWIWNSAINRWALRDGDWKIVRYGPKQPTSADWELYNLKTDPKEKSNVAQQNPETVKQLHGLFLKQRAKDLKEGTGSMPANLGGD